MIDNSFENLRILAKLAGYDNALENVTHKKEKTTGRAFNIYSKIPITIDDSYDIEDCSFFIVHKEWMKMCKLDILTSNSFSPSTKWSSLMICNDVVMKKYNSKDVAFFNSQCQVKYYHPEDENNNDVIGIGENEFEATYNALLNYVKK